MENTNVYMATIISEVEVVEDDKVQLRNEQEESIIVAKNLKQAEAFLEDNQKFQRIIIMTNWVIADSREEYTGDYFMADTTFESPVTSKDDEIIFLIQAKNFTELEEIAEEESGIAFEYIKSVEAIPHKVYR